MSRLERIVAACGGALFDGGRRALIPGPGHSKRDRSVSLLETSDGRILIHCFSPKDNWPQVRDALRSRRLLADDGVSHAEQWPLTTRLAPLGGERQLRAQRLWNEARPLSTSVAERYLLGRALSPEVLHTDALRFHPNMTSLEDRVRRPSLLSAIVDADGRLQGIEITLLSRHGAAKAAVTTPRRVVGRMMGGAIRLGYPHDQLILAEGMESAASASDALQLPAWALLSANNLALFNPPPSLKRIVVAADNDPAGDTAFQRLKRRISFIHVERAAPPPPANDWNDWARQNRNAQSAPTV